MSTQIIDVRRCSADPGRRQLILHCHNLWEYAKTMHAGKHLEALTLFCDDDGKPYIAISTTKEGSEE